MRKFTYKDVSDWKVADVNGKALSLTVKDDKGATRHIERFDGYASASRAAKALGGYAVRV